MNSSNYAIQIIPDLTIDDKYTAIMLEAQNRMMHFTQNAVKGQRVGELYVLERSKLDSKRAMKVLNAEGRLVVGFQFEARLDPNAENFRLYTKKILESGKSVKFYLTPPVQEIMLQLISLEDRRTIGIFSMLSSSADVGFRILTISYGNQLKRLTERVAPFLNEVVVRKLDKLTIAPPSPYDDDEPWKDSSNESAFPTKVIQGERAGSEDNILQVMADDGIFEQFNEYVGHVVSRSDRIHKKRMMLENNPDMPRGEIYQQMVREDLEQLENCYARIHIYLKAFYKNKDRRSVGQNRVLRQFFADQIEKILGETALLEDLLSLNEDGYFKNIDRHKEL